MLLNGQTDEVHLASALAEAHGADLFDLAYLLLGDVHLAKGVTARVLAQAVFESHRYPARQPVVHWLFSLAARHLKTTRRWSLFPRRDPCGVFCQFRPQERFALLLRHFFELSIPEIARILSLPERSLERRIEQLEEQLQAGSPPSDPPQAAALLLSGAREPLPRQAIPENPAGWAGTILTELALLRSRRKRLALIQGALTFLFGALVVLVATRAFVSDNPAPTPSPLKPTAISPHQTPTPTPIAKYAVLYFPSPGETLADIARKTWVDTEILEALNRIPADQRLEAGKPVILGFRPPERASNLPPTATPWPLPAPLTARSSPDEIRQRVSESQRYWQSLWADGLVIRYGDASYIGPPQILRQQLWIVQPDRRLALSGLPEGDLLSVTLKAGYLENQIDFLTGEKITRGNFAYHELDQLVSPFWQIYPEGSYSGAVFEGELKIIRGDHIAGRQSIVVDWFSPSPSGSAADPPGAGQPIYMGRYWVDAHTGVLLRHQEFSRTVPGLLISEVLVTRIAYDVDIPGRLFDLLAPFPTRLAWDYLGEALPEDYVWEPPLLLPSRTILPRLSPPPDFDPSRSRLTFQRYTSFREGIDRFVPVDIFADRYYLATLLMGDLFHITCVRSPNGRYLAYTYQGESLPDLSRLFVLDLTNPTDIQVTSLDHPILAFYSFSADSQQLNWIACDEGGSVCDLGILDPQSGDFIVQFGFNRFNQVIDRSSGKVIGRISAYFPLTIEIDDNGEFDQVSGFFPGERITIDLGEDTAFQPSLEACAAPPADAP